jgi:hypothetical protein
LALFNKLNKFLGVSLHHPPPCKQGDFTFRLWMCEMAKTRANAMADTGGRQVHNNKGWVQAGQYSAAQQGWAQMNKSCCRGSNEHRATKFSTSKTNERKNNRFSAEEACRNPQGQITWGWARTVVEIEGWLQCQETRLQDVIVKEL